MSRDRVKVRAPVWRKLALLTIFFALVPAGVIAASLLESHTSMIEAVSRETRLTATEGVSASLEGLVGAARSDLVGVAQALGDGQIDSKLRVPLARTVVSSSAALDHAVVYDRQGAWIDTIRQEGLEHEPSTEALPERVRERAEARELALGGIDGGRARLVVPLRAADDGEVTGYVVSEVSLASVRDQLKLLGQEKFGGRDGAIFVAGEGGTIVAHAESGRAGAPVAEAGLRERIAAVVGSPGVAVAGDLGEELVTLKPLGQLGWVVVARVPRAQAYAPLRRMRWLVWGTLALAALASVTLAVGFARRLTRPIDALVAQCQALARRDFGARVELGTRDELATLGATLNEAASELERSEAELLRQGAIRADLGRYLPREVVEHIVQGQGLEALQVRRAEVTVLFADVVAFTPLCEGHAPEDVVAILNELFTIVTEIIFRHGGVVDKFIGDCVMAFWGAPKDAPDQAELACMAAEDILSWLEIGNANWRDVYGVELQLAVGIHTGEAVVGNVGSETRLSYTAIGEAVNLAARLEAIARPNQILVSQATAARLAGAGFELVEVGQRDLGGEAPTTLHEVML